MDKITVHCFKCGAACAEGLEYCEFCGEKIKAPEVLVPLPPLSSAIPAVEKSAAPPLKMPEKIIEAFEFDFVRATQRTILIMLSGVFLFLCPVPVPYYYKVLAAVSALLGLWAPVWFRAFGMAAMFWALWMIVWVYELGSAARQLFTEKDYYSQGAKGPIPEWALFKKTLFQSLSGFEWVCLFAAASGAAYIFWVGFYAFKLRSVKKAGVKK